LILQRLVWVSLMMAVLGAAPASAQGYQVQTWPVSKTVPDFTLKDLSGHTWQLRALKGRAVLVHFWASWCEPCLTEMPSLQAVAERLGSNKLVVLAVNFKQSSAAIDQFVQKSAFLLPVLPDPQGDLARQWGVKVFPTTVMVGVDGRVRAVLTGEMDWTSQEADKLLTALF
jgi:thiol-disulfide isomerase/thioredoxin